jgi:hypothetical protein
MPLPLLHVCWGRAHTAPRKNNPPLLLLTLLLLTAPAAVQHRR